MVVVKSKGQPLLFFLATIHFVFETKPLATLEHADWLDGLGTEPLQHWITMPGFVCCSVF